ncbi:unnamed protein product [Ectocarpus sp. 4 AP-2014]
MPQFSSCTSTYGTHTQTRRAEAAEIESKTNEGQRWPRYGGGIRVNPVGGRREWTRGNSQPGWSCLRGGKGARAEGMRQRLRHVCVKSERHEEIDKTSTCISRSARERFYSAS